MSPVRATLLGAIGVASLVFVGMPVRVRQPTKQRSSPRSGSTISAIRPRRSLLRPRHDGDLDQRR